MARVRFPAARSRPGFRTSACRPRSACSAWRCSLFPDGRPPSRRWRPALWLTVAGITLIAVGYALRPGPLDDPFKTVSNPLGVPGGFDIFDVASGLGWVFMGVSVTIAAAALVVRLRRSTRNHVSSSSGSSSQPL